MWWCEYKKRDTQSFKIQLWGCNEKRKIVSQNWLVFRMSQMQSRAVFKNGFHIIIITEESQEIEFINYTKYNYTITDFLQQYSHA